MTLKLTIEREDGLRCSFEIVIPEVIETTGEEVPPPSLPPAEPLRSPLRLVQEAA